MRAKSHMRASIDGAEASQLKLTAYRIAAGGGGRSFPDGPLVAGGRTTLVYPWAKDNETHKWGQSGGHGGGRTGC